MDSGPTIRHKGVGRWLVAKTVAVASFAAFVGCGGTDDQPAQAPTEPIETTPEAPPEEPEIALERQRARLFSIGLPEGWKAETEQQVIEEIERSTWQAPGGKATLQIDSIEGETTSPKEKATEVRDAVSSETPEYREISFSKAKLDGQEAFEWVFRDSEGQKVDYLINACQTGYAILGQTTPKRFSEFEDQFEAIAASLRPDCSPKPPATAPDEDLADEPTKPPSGDGSVEQCGSSSATNKQGGNIIYDYSARVVSCPEAKQVLDEYWTKQEAPAGWSCKDGIPFEPGTIAYTCLRGANNEEVATAFWTEEEFEGR